MSLVLVGDSDFDRRAAEAAGARFVLFRAGGAALVAIVDWLLSPG